MDKRPKIIVIIPAFNEEPMIGSVIISVKKTLKGLNHRIIVIDDGSSDQTAQEALKKDVYLLRHILNRGLGASLATGIEFAKKLKPNVIVTLDADGQHDAEEIHKLIDPVINNKCDVVVGSRLLTKSTKMPPERVLVNKIANTTTQLISGIKTTDSQSGYRAFSPRAYNSINLTSQKMEVSSEIFREIGKNKLRYQEVPITAIYTNYSLKKGQSIWNAPNILLKLAINIIQR